MWRSHWREEGSERGNGKEKGHLDFSDYTNLAYR